MFTHKRSKPWFVGLIIVGITTVAARPQAAEAAGLLIADGGFGGVLEIREQQVNVTINNGVAVTEIEQIFLNTENRQVEALYTFPVPEGPRWPTSACGSRVSR